MLIMEDRLDFARERCFEDLRSEPRHPVARRMLWPILELEDDRVRLHVIENHGFRAMEHNYPVRCLTPTFLRACRRHRDGRWEEARITFEEVLRVSGGSSYATALQREAELRLEEIRVRRLPPG